MAIDKKRKRSEGQGKRPKAPTANSKRQKSNAGKRVTSVDSLAWKTVEVPEMFDDAEGFYGLEEVEGVEIVRDGDTVRFVSGCVLQASIALHLLTHSRWLLLLPSQLLVKSLGGLMMHQKKPMELRRMTLQHVQNRPHP
jgi:hypothetical protein